MIFNNLWRISQFCPRKEGIEFTMYFKSKPTPRSMLLTRFGAPRFAAVRAIYCGANEYDPRVAALRVSKATVNLCL
jgi:hypothetical protein